MQTVIDTMNSVSRALVQDACIGDAVGRGDVAAARGDVEDGGVLQVLGGLVGKAGEGDGQNQGGWTGGVRKKVSGSRKVIDNANERLDNLIVITDCSTDAN